MTDPHPDLEALSAYLDGEEAQLTPHVERCDACAATLAELRGAAATVATRLPPLDPAVADGAVAAALAAFDAPRSPAPGPTPVAVAPTAGGGAAPDDRVVPFAPRGRPVSRWLVAGSGVAAAVALIVGAVAMIGQRGNTEADVALSGSPTEAVAGAPEAADSVVRLGDLGPIGSDAELEARLLADRGVQHLHGRVAGVDDQGSGGTDTGDASSEANTGASSSAAANTGNTGQAFAQGAAGGDGGAAVGVAPPGPPPTVVLDDARACEGAVRASRDLGPLRLHATAAYEGTPAVVLGFGPPGGGDSPLTVLVRSLETCDPLAEVAVP